MPTAYHLQIAQAALNVIAGVSGTPTLREVRTNDQLSEDEADEAIIATLGEDPVVLEVTGANSATPGYYGDVCKGYGVGFAFYLRKLTDPTTNLDRSPLYILQCKQALNKPILSGVPGVYDTDLVQNQTWENQDFSKGLLVSRFGVVFYHAESRNG